MARTTRSLKCLLISLLLVICSGVILLYVTSFGAANTVVGFFKRKPAPNLSPVGWEPHQSKKEELQTAYRVIEPLGGKHAGPVKDFMVTKRPKQASYPNIDWHYYDPLYHQQSLKISPHHNETQGCRIPLLNPWDDRIKMFVMGMDKHRMVCPEPPPLTYIWNRTHIRIKEANAKHYKASVVDSCSVSFFDRYTDHNLVWSDGLPLKRGAGLHIPLLEQFMIVSCGETNSKHESEYMQVHIRLTGADVPEIEAKVGRQKEESKRRLSVLMFYNDGISHVMSRRVMNQTYYYLLNEQDGVPLSGYHTVGMNTFPNMIPYLTGQHVSELSVPYQKQYFDHLDMNMLWSNFSDGDYITGFSEDSKYSTFNFLKEGFDDQPTDYYFKNVVNFIEDLGACKATRGYVHQALLHILDEFLLLHKDHDYFFWWFLNHLSHAKSRPLARADIDYYEFFKRHFEAGTFDNTLVIFGSDHGARFGNLRETALGRVEERLPLHLMVFPQWFRKDYKDMFETFQDNARNALLTPFDMHETLLDILHEVNKPREDHKRNRDGYLTRGLSLFGKVPLSRTCRDAGIPPNYCICRATKPLPTTDKAVVSAVDAAVKYINDALRNHRHKCQHLRLSKIDLAQSTHGFTKTLADGRMPFHDYIITFTVEPGGGMFEATVRQTGNSQDYVVQGHVGRLNLYGSTSHCIKSDLLLKNYCYCMKQVH